MSGSTSEPMDFSSSNVTFTIGTDKKMTMSLDDIIESSKKSKKVEQRRKGGKALTKNNTAGKTQRKRDLVKSVARSASDSRAPKIAKLRGLSIKVKKPSARVQIARTTTKFAVRKNAGARGTPRVGTWATQQKMRQKAREKKMNIYKSSNASSSFLSNHANVNSNQPSFKVNIRNRNERSTPRRSLITRPTFNNRRTVNVDRAQANSQNNQRRVVNARRGITGTQQNQGSKQGSSLNARFSGVGKTTKQTGPRSFTTVNARKSTNGSGASRNNGRGRQGGDQGRQGGGQGRQGGGQGRQGGGQGRQGGGQGRRKQGNQDTSFRIHI